VSVIAGVHPVREALRAGRTLDRVVVAKGAGGAKVQEIVALCKQQGIPVRFEPREAIERASHGAVHQGIIAYGPDKAFTSEADLLTRSRCLVILDGVEDPHNLGAIIRTAHAAGADAIMIPDRRAAGITETVTKASAGAIEHLPVVKIGNVRQELERLKEQRFWIYGLDERGSVDYDQVEYAAPTVFVLGGEGKGLHEHVRKQCDFLVRIPMAGAIASLNVSVAAGIVLFDWRRKSSIATD
jgi:23S rRNA (guanosine2251-2'-O)-methyltransferase